MSIPDGRDGQQAIVYIDSPNEQEAWLIATFGPTGSWKIASQMWQSADNGDPHEVLEIALSSGDRVPVIFAEATPDDSLSGEANDRTGEMEETMQRATEYAEANPPHHPGSLPRFPIPSPSYKNALAVPLPVLAVDDSGTRGLYAPPRQVAVSREDGRLIGVGEFPGFDPEHWPPPRLGDWPPAQLDGLPQIQLQGMIARFSACWSRVLDAWFAGETKPSDRLRADVRESLHRRAFLELMEFLPYYDRLNPVFATWLDDMVGGEEGSAGGRDARDISH